jgi:replicative DNA helicase
LIDSSLYEEKREVLDESMFYDSHTKLIFWALKTLYANRVDIDLLTLKSYLEANKMLHRVWWISYLAELTEIVPTTAHIDSYIKLLVEDFRIKELQRLWSKLIKEPYEVNKQLKNIDNLLSNIDSKSGSIATYNLHGVLDIVCNSKVKKLSTWFKDLDNYLDGWVEDSRLYTIAWRPWNGKSLFGLNLALRFAKREKTMFISLEMPLKHIWNRLVSMISKWGESISSKIDNLDDSLVSQVEKNLLITDEWYNLSDIIKLYKANSETKVIIIDYLSFIKVEWEFSRKDEYIGENTRELKKLAKESGIIIILLAQLNREASSSIPKLHHLKDSGNIEQDSDVVILLDRWDEFSTELRVIVAKNRDGKLWEMKLKADFSKYKLSDYEETYQFSS